MADQTTRRVQPNLIKLKEAVVNILHISAYILQIIHCDTFLKTLSAIWRNWK